MELTNVPAIGIDLGTTSSCVAIFLHGKVEIINNDQGHRTTPSYVAFTEVEHLVGEAAESQACRNPTNTIFDSKRLIGRRFDESLVQKDIRNWPFAVVDMVGKPMYKVQYHSQEKLFTPEEICSLLIRKMKQTAETRLRDAVSEAVIAVPAYFNDSQRQATKDAGLIAGLRVTRIINEPTAAALAYGLDQNLPDQRNVLIFDLGGGTFDVTVLSITQGSQFEVKSTAGNTHFGGKDFDNRLLKYFIELYKKNYKTNISNNRRAIKRLLTACEHAKKTLSTSTEAMLEVEALSGNVDFRMTISRSKFEELCSDLFKSTLTFVEQALKDARLYKSQIHEVVLAGGSARMPMIQQLLREFFEGKQLNKSINPDEAVAYGAAVLAAIISGDRSSFIRDVLLVDVTPLSLGIETDGGVMNCIVRRGTAIPVRASNVFTTCTDDQPAVTIQVQINIIADGDFNSHSQNWGHSHLDHNGEEVESWQDDHSMMLINTASDTPSFYSRTWHTTSTPDLAFATPDISGLVFEGERAMTKDNNLLGWFELSGIAPAPRGVPQIHVNFDIDDNGILNVNAQDSRTGRTNSMVITHNKGRLCAADIERIIADGEKYREEDEKRRKLVLLRNELQDYICDIKQYLEVHDDQVTAEDRTLVRQRCGAVLMWLKTNPLASIAEIQEKLKEMRALCTPIMTQPNTQRYMSQKAADRQDDQRYMSQKAADRQDDQRYMSQKAADRQDDQRYMSQKAADRQDDQRYMSQKAADRQDDQRYMSQKAADRQDDQRYMSQKAADRQDDQRYMSQKAADRQDDQRYMSQKAVDRQDDKRYMSLKAVNRQDDQRYMTQKAVDRQDDQRYMSQKAADRQDDQRYMHMTWTVGRFVKLYDMIS